MLLIINKFIGLWFVEKKTINKFVDHDRIAFEIWNLNKLKVQKKI